MDKSASSDWQSTRAKKFVCAKAIIRSNKGRILLVKPIYKEVWQFVGGGVELNESPLDALGRELMEEINLSVIKDDFLIYDVCYRNEYDSLNLLFKYQKEVNESTRLQINDEEISSFRFVPEEKVGSMIGEYYRDIWQNYLERK